MRESYSQSVIIPTLGTAEASRPRMIRTRATSTTLTDEQKERIIDGLRSGQSLASVLRDNDDLPGAMAIHALRRKDAAFGREFEQARMEGLEANIDEALDYNFAVRHNKQLSNAAAKYAETVLKSAAAMAPKRFGSMLKLANADGERLSVALVNYSASAPQALEAEAVDVLPAPDAARDR